MAVYDCCNRPIRFQAAVINPCVSSMECLYDHCIACLQVLNATVPPQPAYPAPREPVPLLDVAAANGEVAPEIVSGGVPTGAIVGGIFVALGVALIACAALFLLKRRSKAHLAGGPEAEGYHAGQGGAGVPVRNLELTGEVAVTAGSHASSKSSGKVRTVRPKDGRKARLDSLLTAA